MRYWAFLVAKLAAAGAVLLGLRKALVLVLPKPDIKYSYMRDNPFGYDLTYTFSMLLLTLVAVGVFWAVAWDQRYRCRTCLRRLRMPVQTGSWTHVLFGGPRTEYICPYGHGTLKVAEFQITGSQQPEWQPHDDYWTELNSLEETKK
jgi:hypothetical protein